MNIHIWIESMRRLDLAIVSSFIFNVVQLFIFEEVDHWKKDFSV